MPRGDIDKQYLLGQYMTPKLVAEEFFRHLSRPAKTWRVLDPACGDGNLLIVTARRLLAEGLSPKTVASRLCGIDIDPQMAESCRDRLANELHVNPAKLRIYVGDYLQSQQTLFAENDSEWSDFGANIVLSNPPYGQGREYEFFEVACHRHSEGTELVFLVPLAFMDRLEGGHIEPLRGRPLGVTTGHCLVWHTAGDPWHFRTVKSANSNRSAFNVFSGVKLYEKGAGTPPQSEDVVKQKPFSSEIKKTGWLPCIRTGDIQPFNIEIGRLWVDWGPHLAHPKELSTFQGPRIFVRRVPIWSNRHLGAAYLERDALCAGDVLVVRHETNDRELLQGLCTWLNEETAAACVLGRRPSVQHRTSFPKISGKDLNMLFENDLPDQKQLRRMAKRDSNVV
tara:strand:- start:951 stop:2135 length:1185 start_codon:yes stop_codon:yes gene_type:complete